MDDQNPFVIVAARIRGLQENFLGEIGIGPDGMILNSGAGPMLHALEALAKSAEACAQRVDELARRAPQAFAAFERALGKGME